MKAASGQLRVGGERGGGPRGQRQSPGISVLLGAPLKPSVADFSAKPSGEYFRLCGPDSVCHNYFVIATQKQPSTSGCGCVPVTLFIKVFQ